MSNFGSLFPNKTLKITKNMPIDSIYQELSDAQKRLTISRGFMAKRN
jgi:hypothetical protein